MAWEIVKKPLLNLSKAGRATLDIIATREGASQDTQDKIVARASAIARERKLTSIGQGVLWEAFYLEVKYE